MVKNYELYFILNAELSAEKRTAELEKIQANLASDLSAQNIQLNDQGSKKLAYPIGKSQLGHYVLVHFDVEYANISKLNGFEKKFNVNDAVIRYILVDITDQNTRIAAQSLNKNTEVENHQDLNKGKMTNKKDVIKHLGIKAIDYKDVEFIRQFASPYHKIFARNRTGNTAKSQRMINVAIKRARHMALMPFTPKSEM